MVIYAFYRYIYFPVLYYTVTVLNDPELLSSPTGGGRVN
jgi:hypothetical protein